jgi:hypothetical protein
MIHAAFEQLTLLPEVHSGPVRIHVVLLGAYGHDPFVCDGPDRFHAELHREMDLRHEYPQSHVSISIAILLL